LDKVNHPEIHYRIGPKKPDFVVHVPGDMSRNLVVVEVKPISTRNDRLQDDLNILQLFLGEAKYYRAIMLIYGNDESTSIDRIKEKFRAFSNEKLLLICHKEPKAMPIALRV